MRILRRPEPRTSVMLCSGTLSLPLWLGPWLPCPIPVLSELPPSSAFPAPLPGADADADADADAEADVAEGADAEAAVTSTSIPEP